MSIQPPTTDREESITRCPWCGKVNPQIRRTPLVSENLLESATIYSCYTCKKIITIQQMEAHTHARPNA